jgi:hypothetical protein
VLHRLALIRCAAEMHEGMTITDAKSHHSIIQHSKQNWQRLESMPDNDCKAVGVPQNKSLC